MFSSRNWKGSKERQSDRLFKWLLGGRATLSWCQDTLPVGLGFKQKFQELWGTCIIFSEYIPKSHGTCNILLHMCVIF